MNEAVVIPIVIDPKAGVAGLAQLGDQAQKTNDQLGGASSGAGKFGESMKGIARNALQMIGVMSMADEVVKAVVGGLLDAVTGSNKLASSTKMLTEIQEKAVASTRDEVVQLQLLYDTAKNTSLSYAQRQAAIDEMNRKYPELHRNITLENVLTRQTADAIDGVLQKMVQKVQLQGMISQIAELQNQLEGLRQIYAAVGNTALMGPTLLKRIADTKDRIEDLYGRAKELQGENKLDLGGMLGGNAGDVKVEPKKLTIAPKKVEIAKWTDTWNNIPVNITIPPEEAKFDGMAFGQMFSKELADYWKNNPVDFSLINAEADYETAKQKAAELLNQNMVMADLISSALTPAFDGMFEAILNKEDALKAFFNGIGQSVKRLISQLMAAAIQAGVLSLLTGGAGKGGLSFGKAFGQMLGFAQGGLVTGPVSALVGEGMGTNPSNPEVVAPLDKLKSFFSNMLVDGRFSTGNMGTSGSIISMPSEVWLRQSGRDMLGVITLEQLSQGRTG